MASSVYMSFLLYCLALIESADPLCSIKASRPFINLEAYKI